MWFDWKYANKSQYKMHCRGGPSLFAVASSSMEKSSFGSRARYFQIFCPSVVRRQTSLFHNVPRISILDSWFQSLLEMMIINKSKLICKGGEDAVDFQLLLLSRFCYVNLSTASTKPTGRMTFATATTLFLHSVSPKNVDCDEPQRRKWKEALF